MDFGDYNRLLMSQLQQILLDTLTAPVTFVLGMIVLLWGGHMLVEGSVRIARWLKWSTLLIGLTIVAFGTSAPELFFNVIAATRGNSELSFGNVVGSNIANIALVLGLASLIAPLIVHSRVLRVELPLLILISIVMVFLCWLPATAVEEGNPGFGLLDGLAMLFLFIIFTWLWYRMGKKDQTDPMTTEAKELAEDESPHRLFPAIIMFMVGLGALVFGGSLAEAGAVGVAEWLGISKAVIGLTIVALATSMPEVATSIIACRKGHSDLAVGNIVGSNLFNILLVLGLTSLVKPIPAPLPWAYWDLGIMLGLTLILLPIALTSQQRITRVEGVFLVLCYVVYLVFTVIRGA